MCIRDRFCFLLHLPDFLQHGIGVDIRQIRRNNRQMQMVGNAVAPVSYTHLEKDLYTSTVDIALYASHQAYQRIASKYPHTYAVTAGVESEMAVYPFGPSFMKYLAKGAEVSFDGILNEIIYLVDAGSYVEDTIGYAPGDYNFDFISQASAMTLRVGNDSYAAQEIGEKDVYKRQLPHYPKREKNRHHGDP